MRVFIPFLRNFVELRIADSIVIFLRKSDNRQNILLSTDPTVKEKKFGKEKEIKNVKLYKHPNPNSKKTAYVVTRTYTDHKNPFADKVYNNWVFDKNDKRKIKRIKKHKWKK